MSPKVWSLFVAWIVCGIVQIAQMHALPSVMHQMWITPIQTFSLTGHSINVPTNGKPNLSEALPPAFFNEMSSILVNLFSLFSADQVLVNQYRVRHNLHEDASPSDVFFFYQRDLFHMNTSTRCTKTEALGDYYAKVTKILRESILIYCRENYVDENSMSSSAFAALQSSSLFLWASIHANGTSHQAHHHFGSSLSGVLYLKARHIFSRLLAFHNSFLSKFHVPPPPFSLSV